MKVVLKEYLSNDYHTKVLPLPGHLGEALYFRYDDCNNLKLVILFYGFPGTHEVWPSSVESIVQP